MSWNLNASGHCNDKQLEAEVIKKMGAALVEAEATSASMSTSHHGVVDPKTFAEGEAGGTSPTVGTGY